MSFAVAALGGEIVIDTVDGKVIYEVKPGTQTDTKIRLKGKGVPYIRGNGSGDQFVTVTIETPKNMTAAQKEALRKYAEAMNEVVPEKKNRFGKKKK